MGGAAADQLLQLKFAKGTQVEVSSDEEGFRGARYVATVLEPPASKKKSPNYNKVYVEYHSLVADEAGSKPLRERVNVALVRPAPPPEVADSTGGHCLELNHVVDAFLRDGWWTGVITRVLDDSRFAVSFQEPPDEIEFGISELRLHREWLDGKWVRPEKQRTTGLMFSAGKKVEVSFDKEVYRDVWFPAIVLDSGNGSFLVGYQSPSIGDEAGLLKVTVDSLHIRPSPPQLKDKIFVLLEKVDAFYDFGWWSGVITKELPDSRYVVFFKHMNKERELSHSELRPHMEWKDGQWFSASQDILIPSDNQGHVCNNADDTEMAVSLGSSGATMGNSDERTPSSLNTTEKQIEQSTPCNEEASGLIVSPKKKTKQMTPDIDDTHSRPFKKLKEGNAVEGPSLTGCELNTSSMDTPLKETLGFDSPTSGYTGTSISEQPMVGDQPSAKTDILSWGKKVQSRQQKVGEQDNHLTDPVRRKGRRAKSQINSPQTSARGDSARNSAEDIVEKECVTKEIDVPVIIALECKGTRGLRVKKPRQYPGEELPKLTRDQKQQLGDLAIQKSKEGSQFKGGGESNQKRGRGRPPKLLIKSPKASVAVKQQNEDAADDMVVKDCITNEVGLPTTVGMESTRMEGSVPGKEHMKLIGDDKKHLNGSLKQKKKLSSMMKTPRAKKGKLPNEIVQQASSKQHEKHSSKRGRRRTISVNTESPFQDLSGGEMAEVIEIDCVTKEEEMAIDKLPGTMSDDQPLSMWFEGMHSPTTGDGSSIGRTVEQCTEASERQKEISMQSPAVDVKGDFVPVENQSLPFVKTSPLWETVESMEVFRMMPQKPHFHPLDCCKESSREGLAIGSMVTFSGTVEKTSRLQFDDPRVTIEDSLETLLELESHGFDVTLVRNRLTGLLSIKDKQEQLQDQSNELKNQIMEHNLEKSKIDEEIDEIDKQIRDLQGKRALAVSRKGIKDSEVASLESAVDGISEGIKSTCLEFECLAAAPW